MAVNPARVYNDQPAVVAAQAAQGSLTILAPPLDADADGLPDVWETENFGSLSGNAQSDHDQDGITDGQEFLAGTDPTKAGSALRITGSQRVDRSGRPAAWIQWEGQAGRSYQVEWSDGPIGPGMVWHPVYNPTLHKDGALLSWTDDGTRTLAEPRQVPQRYYRIVLAPDL